MAPSTFDPTLCDRRWLKSHMTLVHHTFNKDTDMMYNEAEKSNEVPKTTTGRYTKVLSLVQKIAAVAAESTRSQFLEK